ncbi:hypothetical protein GBA52_000105 [Prunus armeniaca]|nr:hypothetical protein GBA52_000105 [Prunus armeniaca]
MAWEKRYNTARKPCASCFLSFAELALNSRLLSKIPPFLTPKARRSAVVLGPNEFEGNHFTKQTN